MGKWWNWKWKTQPNKARVDLRWWGWILRDIWRRMMMWRWNLQNRFRVRLEIIQNGENVIYFEGGRIMCAWVMMEKYETIKSHIFSFKSFFPRPKLRSSQTSFLSYFLNRWHFAVIPFDTCHSYTIYHVSFIIYHLLFTIYSLPFCESPAVWWNLFWYMPSIYRKLALKFARWCFTIQCNDQRWWK